MDSWNGSSRSSMSTSVRPGRRNARAFGYPPLGSPRRDPASVGPCCRCRRYGGRVIGLAQPVIPADGPRGSSLASWTPLIAFGVVLGVVLLVLVIRGRNPAGRSALTRGVLRVPAALERRTGLPGWAATSL